MCWPVSEVPVSEVPVAVEPGGLGAFFVTGTDTGVGKTVISALLCAALGAAYWKPVQTGAAQGDDDTAEVAQLAGLAPGQVYAPARVYQDPSSPERAAGLEGQRVAVADLWPRLPAARPLVVEGAGGVLVPLNERETMLDLMTALALPVVLVARSTLGTINHTLLSLEALRARRLDVGGVVLSGPHAPHNREAIERHGQVRVLAEVPVLAQVDRPTVARVAGPLRAALADRPVGT